MGKCLFMRKGETHTSPKAGLPNGYTTLEWIQSTGTQYVDTEFKPKYNSRVMIDISGLEATGFLFGTRDVSALNATNQFSIYRKNDSEIRSDYFGTNASLSISDVSFRTIIDKNANVVTMFGSTVTNTVKSSGECPYPLYLFALNNVGAVSSYASYKLYSCQIYDNGVLVRDYVPCINPSGEIGLYDLVGKKFYGNKGTGVFKCNLDFENCTWAEIIEACRTKSVPSFWSVGDQKSMTINGTDYLIDIIGKNHDDYADGSGKAPLTFQMHDCYATTFQMNSYATNSGDWESCAVRTTKLPTILAVMPSEVQSAVKEVNKRTGASAFPTTADKLFLLSEIEVFGTSYFSSGGEGSQYEYYKAGNSKAKTIEGSAGAWWERSPMTANTTHFCAVDSTGAALYYRANESVAVAPAFCF